MFTKPKQGRERITRVTYNANTKQFPCPALRPNCGVRPAQACCPIARQEEAIVELD